VRITCRREGARFLISVENSGREGQARGTHGTGIGQRNVRDRLRLVYGEAASLVCEPLTEGGYRSLISLPMSEARP
jgi:LytS/YehU family sensor histidine kinase